MCGVVGIYRHRGIGGDSRQHLCRMLSAIRHRGPDEVGYRIDPRCALGAVRLSIIDLEHGQQPMQARGGRYWLAFNGELFNYIELRRELENTQGVEFATQSDTEVLLESLIAWDVDALPKLNGQYAFLFYDRRSGRLLAGRDRFGERPLYFTRTADGFLFASEIKSLLCHPSAPRALDVSSLGHAFHLWTQLPHETCFRGIRSIPPGHFGELVSDDLSVRPYYRLPIGGEPFAGSVDEAAEELRERLRRSVHIRMRSDVPVGTYVSGGIDSAITTWLAVRESSHRVNTFAIGFDDAEYDESVFQSIVATSLDTDHHPITISKPEIADWFPRTIWHAETALFRTAPVPMLRLSSHVHDHGYKVVLSGEGADEALLGYDIFKETWFRRRYHDFAGDEERIARLLKLYPYLPHFAEANARAMLPFFAPGAADDTNILFSHLPRFNNGLLTTRFLAEPYDAVATLDELAGFLTQLHPGIRRASDIERAQVIEYCLLLGGYLLCSQGDRMQSAHSVEGRCPFLDHELVEFACSLPVDFRLADMDREKHVLRLAFAGVLPRELTQRPKIPYRAPDAASFLVGGLPPWAADLLERGTDWLNRGLVQRFVAKLQRGDPTQISPRDDQAFVSLLSALSLQDQFVDRFPDVAPVADDQFAVAEHLEATFSGGDPPRC